MNAINAPCASCNDNRNNVIRCLLFVKIMAKIDAKDDSAELVTQKEIDTTQKCQWTYLKLICVSNFFFAVDPNVNGFQARLNGMCFS